ncbi:MAG: hypothetical protein EBT95_11065, partial [Verrucomicrobia bacterium]|nr:hypothetical protein [Verrucomicrobiota bacterium]
MRVLLCLLFWSSWALAADPFTPSAVQKGSLKTQIASPPSAQVVTIGFYPVSVHQLDIADNTYYIDTYVWL